MPFDATIPLGECPRLLQEGMTVLKVSASVGDQRFTFERPTRGLVLRRYGGVLTPERSTVLYDSGTTEREVDPLDLRVDLEGAWNRTVALNWMWSRLGMPQLDLNPPRWLRIDVGAWNGNASSTGKLVGWLLDADHLGGVLFGNKLERPTLRWGRVIGVDHLLRDLVVGRPEPEGLDLLALVVCMLEVARTTTGDP
jgi:hypothetical protein